MSEFFRLSDGDPVGVIPRPRSKGSWVLLGRQLGKTPDSLRARYSTPEGRMLLEAAYAAPGSLWRTHLKGERYSVDVKLPGVPSGNLQAAEARLATAGLDCSWIMPMDGNRAPAEVVLFRPRPAVDGNNHEAAVERRGRGK